MLLCCFVQAEVRSTGQCYNVVGVPRLELADCDVTDMILILDAIQGRHRSQHHLVHHQQQQPPRGTVGMTSSCRYSRGDCTDDVTAEMETRLTSQCVGQSACSIVVDVGWMARCNVYGQYGHVTYQCVPRESSISLVIQSCFVGQNVSSSLLGSQKTHNAVVAAVWL